jgi:hypothetical protein
MARGHKPLFNGLHLRLEADAAAWIEMFGGLHTLWGYYMDAARGAGFDRRTPLVRPEPPAGQVVSLCSWRTLTSAAAQLRLRAASRVLRLTTLVPVMCRCLQHIWRQHQRPP